MTADKETAPTAHKDTATDSDVHQERRRSLEPMLMIIQSTQADVRMMTEKLGDLENTCTDIKLRLQRVENEQQQWDNDFRETTDFFRDARHGWRFLLGILSALALLAAVIGNWDGIKALLGVRH